VVHYTKHTVASLGPSPAHCKRTECKSRSPCKQISSLHPNQHPLASLFRPAQQGDHPGHARLSLVSSQQHRPLREQVSSGLTGDAQVISSQRRNPPAGTANVTVLLARRALPLSSFKPSATAHSAVAFQSSPHIWTHSFQATGLHISPQPTVLHFKPERHPLGRRVLPPMPKDTAYSLFQAELPSQAGEDTAAAESVRSTCHFKPAVFSLLSHWKMFPVANTCAVRCNELLQRVHSTALRFKPAAPPGQGHKSICPCL
jgi:hypothetical protein